MKFAATARRRIFVLGINIEIVHLAATMNAKMKKVHRFIGRIITPRLKLGTLNNRPSQRTQRSPGAPVAFCGCHLTVWGW
jgi:hypothetical protein